MRRLSGSEALLQSLAALAASGVETTDRPAASSGVRLPNQDEFAVLTVPGLYGMKPRRLNDEMLGIFSPARGVGLNTPPRQKH
jgi:hypothetical protein